MEKRAPNHPRNVFQSRYLIISVAVLCCINLIAPANARKYQLGTAFVSHHQSQLIHGQIYQNNIMTIARNSDNGNNEPNESDQTSSNFFFTEEEDPDGTPLFDQRATLFGLEPKAELDSMDNGLAFTGPIIMFFSLYFTLSLFFAGESEVPAIFEDLAGNQIH